MKTVDDSLHRHGTTVSVELHFPNTSHTSSSSHSRQLSPSLATESRVGRWNAQTLPLCDLQLQTVLTDLNFQ